MKRIVLAGFLSLAVACTPGVPKATGGVAGQIHARFDPSATPAVVPAPNDLAINAATGHIAIPLGANPSAADVELAAYFGALNGFSADSTASATFDGLLDPASINTSDVLVMDVSGAAPQPVTGFLATVRPLNQGSAISELDLIPPSAGWTPGHDYAVILVSGAQGLKAVGGFQIFGSTAWALVRSRLPLVKCSSGQCKPTTNLIPSTFTDPAARYADQVAKAKGLEQVRLGYAPLFAAVEAKGISRADVPLLWTFKIATQEMIAYNPSGAVPQVPVPNDLAINPATHQVNAPVDPRTSPANQEFTTTYLNTLNGFPTNTNAAAQALGPSSLDPATVNAASVIVLDLTPAAAGGSSPPPGTAAVYSGATNQIVIPPPAAGWQRGHRYAAVIVGGTGGVTAVDAAPVSPDAAWVLLRGVAPLVDCTTLSASCHSVVTAVPLSDADAVVLETIRRQTAPLLDNVTALTGATRSQMLAGWTFSIVDGQEPVFDPLHQIIPFPNDLLLATDGGASHVNLPVPDAGTNPLLQAQAQLIRALNTLDGFSTTAAIETQHGGTTGALTNNVALDATSLNAGVGLVKLTKGYSDPIMTPCLSDMPADSGCARYFSPLADAGVGTYAQQLLLVPQVPLDERTQYGAFLTTDLKDSNGKSVIASPTFALLRLANPLVDSDGHSNVLGVTDAQAAAAEPLRAGLAPFFQGLTALTHIPVTRLALAWSFTTQSEISQLAQLHSIPSHLPAAFSVVSLTDVTSGPFGELTPTNFPYAPQFSDGGINSKVGSVFVGEMTLPNLLNGPGGTIAPPPLAAPKPESAFFTLTVPAGSVPPSGFPVVIFGHGLGDWHGSVMLIADQLAAQGMAMIAVDDAFHGNRSSCVGSHVATGQASDDSSCLPGNTCDATPTSSTYGKCISAARAACDASPNADFSCYRQRQGVCVNTDGGAGGYLCQGGDFLREGDLSAPPADPFSATAGKPVISGWNFLDTNNLFRTRDNIRQTTVDYAQVANVAAASGANTLNALLTAKLGNTGSALNADRILFLGMSLGGITGTLYNSVAPESHTAVLNVPGGDFPTLILNSPSFTAQANALRSQLALQGIAQGTVAFDQFIRTAKWILDPADPVNMAYGLQHSILTGIPQIPGDRQTFIYYIDQDQTIPNISTQELIAAANRPSDAACTIREEVNLSSTTYPLTGRHSFILRPIDGTAATAPFTIGAQIKAAGFLAHGTVP